VRGGSSRETSTARADGVFAKIGRRSGERGDAQNDPPVGRAGRPAGRGRQSESARDGPVG